jgi:hypothetical protein
MRWGRGTYHETGSDAQPAWTSDNVDYGQRNGHQIPAQTVAVPFYGVNPARNNGADIEPIPITPVRGQNWPEMQVQLKNGMEGKAHQGNKLTYDDYLRLLNEAHPNTAHASSTSFASRGGNVQQGPSPYNVGSMIQTTAGAQPNAPGGPGFLAGNLNLAGRTYFG